LAQGKSNLRPREKTLQNPKSTIRSTSNEDMEAKYYEYSK